MRNILQSNCTIIIYRKYILREIITFPSKQKRLYYSKQCKFKLVITNCMHFYNSMKNINNELIISR